MKYEMQNWIIGFVKQSAPFGELVDNELIYEQLRSLVTAYCLMFDVLVDTNEFDILVANILNELKTEIDFEKLDQFLGEYLA